jgi:hypothetical protein
MLNWKQLPNAEDYLAGERRPYLVGHMDESGHLISEALIFEGDSWESSAWSSAEPTHILFDGDSPFVWPLEVER